MMLSLALLVILLVGTAVGNPTCLVRDGAITVNGLSDDIGCVSGEGLTSTYQTFANSVSIPHEGCSVIYVDLYSDDECVDNQWTDAIECECESINVPRALGGYGSTGGARLLFGERLLSGTGSARRMLMSSESSRFGGRLLSGTGYYRRLIETESSVNAMPVLRLFEPRALRGLRGFWDM